MNFSFSTKCKVLLIFVFAGFSHATAQNFNSDSQSHSNYAATSTGLPFLRFMPDARSGSMGESGVAILPDANSLSINPAKMVFLNQKAGFSLSHNPWLKSVVKDMNLSYLSAYLNSGQQAISASLRYFSVGEITYTDEHAATIGKLNPIEYAFDLGYSRKLGPDFSLGTAVRYVQSRLALNEQATALSSSQNAISVDISAFLLKPKQLFGYEGTVSAGINISNIGVPIVDEQTNQKSFLPTNLKVGAGASIDVDASSRLTAALDFNKLLAPEPANFSTSVFTSPNGNSHAGEHAPISLSTGLEYLFKQQFALRAGYIYEGQGAAKRNHLSLGVGFKYELFNVDVAYLPVNLEKSPMANTLKITLMFNFGHLVEDNRQGMIKPR